MAIDTAMACKVPTSTGMQAYGSSARHAAISENAPAENLAIPSTKGQSDGARHVVMAAASPVMQTKGNNGAHATLERGLMTGSWLNSEQA